MNIAADLTWYVLAEISGATAMVCAITQITKGLRWIKEIPTQIYSYILALLVLIPATYFTMEEYALDRFFLVFFNAVIVALASNGAYNVYERFKEPNGKH